MNGRVLCCFRIDRLGWLAVSLLFCVLVVGGNGRADISRDGTRVSAVVNGQVRIWDVASGRLVRTLRDPGRAGGGGEAHFSPDGKSVLTSAYDSNTAHIFNVTTGQIRRTLHGDSWLWDLSFSPDGTRIVGLDGEPLLSQERGVVMWDTATGRRLHTLCPGECYFPSVMFSPDGRKLLTGSIDGTATIWSTGSGRILRSLGKASDWITPTTATFSPDGKLVATASEYGTSRGGMTVRIFDIASGRTLQTIQRASGPRFSPNAKLIAVDIGRAIEIRDLASGQTTHTLYHPGGVDAPVFDANGKLIATLGNGSPSDLVGVTNNYKAVRIWDVASGRLLRTLHVAPFDAARFIPNSERILTYNDEAPQIWDAADGRLLRTLHG